MSVGYNSRRRGYLAWDGLRKIYHTCATLTSKTTTMCNYFSDHRWSSEIQLRWGKKMIIGEHWRPKKKHFERGGREALYKMYRAEPVGLSAANKKSGVGLNGRMSGDRRMSKGSSAGQTKREGKLLFFFGKQCPHVRSTGSPPLSLMGKREWQKWSGIDRGCQMAALVREGLSTTGGGGRKT